MSVLGVLDELGFCPHQPYILINPETRARHTLFCTAPVYCGAYCGVYCGACCTKLGAIAAAGAGSRDGKACLQLLPGVLCVCCMLRCAMHCQMRGAS